MARLADIVQSPVLHAGSFIGPGKAVVLEALRLFSIGKGKRKPEAVLEALRKHWWPARLSRAASVIGYTRRFNAGIGLFPKTVHMVFNPMCTVVRLWSRLPSFP